MTTQQVLDKQGLQHYATKMCNAENRKVGSKSLPTALNDIDTAIDGFKTLFNNEYGTPVTATIKNNSNSFTVGVGNGIDKSREVENSFTDIELSGNSMVNIYNGVREISSSVNRVNDFATITNIKPNTQYTIKYAVKSSNKLTSPSLTSFFRIQACDKNNNPINEWLFGVSHNVETSYTYHTAIFNTPSELSNIVLTIRNCYSEWNLQSNTSYIKDIIIIEGNYTNKSLPLYFEGLKSIGENEENKISILSHNKNLIDGGLDYYSCQNSKYIEKLADGSYKLKRPVGSFDGAFWLQISPLYNYIFKKDSKYYVNFDIEYNNCKKVQFGLVCPSSTTDSTRAESAQNHVNAYITVNKNISKKMSKEVYNYPNLLSLEIGFGIDLVEDTSKEAYIIIKNVMLTEKPYNDYEPPKEDKKEILLNEPLRSLPDGTKDTIEKIGGEWKIVRRCGQYTLTESNPWIERGSNNKAMIFYLSDGDMPFEYNNMDTKSKNKLICDKLTTISVIGGYVEISDLEKEYVTVLSNDIKSSAIYVSILKNNLSSQDVNGFKKWLSNNPLKVIYELKTPIIEDIDPVVLQCWKDGTISIDEILPVESTHTVSLNKTAQIQNNIEELTSLRNRVKKLEEQYNSTLLTQAYQTILLNFDNDL